MAQDLSISIGPRKIVIDIDTLTNKRVKLLYKALNEVKRKHNPYVKYPQLSDIPILGEDGQPTGETRNEDYQEWKIRVLTQIANDLTPREGESTEDFESRVIKLNLADHLSVKVLEFLNEIAVIWNLPTIAEEDFENTSLNRARDFCFNLLQLAAIEDPDEVFFPPRQV